jgi:hypothetical protein
MRGVAAVAQERGCCRFQWQAIDFNESAISYYKNKLGARERMETGDAKVPLFSCLPAPLLHSSPAPLLHPPQGCIWRRRVRACIKCARSRALTPGRIQWMNFIMDRERIAQFLAETAATSGA